MKRKIESTGSCEAVVKKSKTERFPISSGYDRQLRGTTNRRSSKGGKGVEGERAPSDRSRVETEETVITHQLWKQERHERDTKYTATDCNKGEVSY